MSAPTLRQRRALHLVAQHPSVRAYQQTQRAHYEDQLGALRYEQERAARIDAELQAQALLDRVRAAGQTGCAEPTERELALAEVVRIVSVGLLAITVMLAFGWLLAPFVARVLVAAGVL
ncbi:MAG TPA: hypothetical protein VGU03_11070 [Frateuria sp.]|uniref:hypothetical protein n=1 Tax=Frateuria sp. TaxID=2211372 RepID=UPI002DF009A5|nr:hypothetical protein [Frateuria sp.]